MSPQSVGAIEDGVVDIIDQELIQGGQVNSARDIEDGVVGIIDQELIQGGPVNSYPGKGQCFFGSWSFPDEELRALLSGTTPGTVSSSIVEFVALDSFFAGEFKFGVFLTLRRAAEDSFVLSWGVSVITPGLLQEHLDCFEIHLHGHTTIPSVMPLGYEGSVSMSFQTNMPPDSTTLSVTGISKLLELDGVVCSLTIRFYCMGQEARITSAKAFDSRAVPIGYRWTESGRKLQRRTHIGFYRWADCGFTT
jgi:hypothetical protein